MGASDDLLSGGIPIATPTLSPIGVPSDFVAETGGQEVAPRYFDGEQYKPAGLPRAEVAELQRMLSAAGLIPRGTTYRNGVWDDVSIAAYSQLLAYANQSGAPLERALSDWSRTAQEETVVADPYLRPDPASVRTAVKRAVKSVIGREVTDDELPNLVSTFAGLDEQAYEAQVAGEQAAVTGATSIQAVDPEARFEEYLEDRYAPEIDRNRGVVDLAESRKNLMSNVFALDRMVGGGA